MLRGGRAGGGYSTVSDLHKFSVALQNSKLLKPKTVARHCEDHNKTGYGYESLVQQTFNGKVVGHGGGFPGISAMLELHLDKGFTVVVVASHDSAALPLAQRMGQLLQQIR